MRGVQDTVRPLRYVIVGFAVSAVLCPLFVYGWLGAPELGLPGSAVANVVGQRLAAALFCRALVVEKVPMRPQPSVLPGIFTDDRAVLTEIGVPWWFLVAQLPLAGIVFAIDGVLLGAGDAAFMRTATLVSALVGFLPLIWLSLVLGWGLLGIWAGLTTFVVLRLVFVDWRAVSGRWLVAGIG